LTFSDMLVKEYVNLRKSIREQSVSGRDPFAFKFKIIKRISSMVGLTLLLNWVTPHLMVDDFLGGWSLTRIMLLAILIETLLFAYDVMWSFMMNIVHHLLNIIDHIVSFPPIDFPEDREDDS
jgi:hypothetical protein